MVATNTEQQTQPKPPPGAKGASGNKKPPGNPPGSPPPKAPRNDGPPPTWDDVVRQGTVLRLMEHLNVGVQLAADISKDPAFSADDRLQAVFAAARMINANAHLGKTIGYLAQVEQRRRTVVQHLDPPKVWNDSNSIPEVLLERELTLKMLRYMKVIADETFDPAIEEAAQEKAAQTKASPANPAQPEKATSDGAGTPA